MYLLGLVFAMFCFTACEDDDPVVNESEVLVEYLESTDSPLMKDYVNTELPSIMGATEVKTLNATGDVYIMDIRAAEDFNTGHIPNAVNVALGDVVTHIESINPDDYSKVAVVCYTGQSAGFATLLLRLLGYDNVFSLKWGMSSWHDDFAGKWKSNISNMYATQFETDVNEKAEAGDLPVISTGFENGQDILEARVDALLAEGYGPARISSGDVFNNPDNYYVVNYWPEAQYLDPGHIPTAIQYTPKESLKLDVALTTLPTDKPIVVYCYTGQTSSYIAAYLRLLGYDAKSLLFGANGMIYDMMVAKEMTTFNAEDHVKGYIYE
jgi:rhodanese-related sulfurtransferase